MADCNFSLNIPGSAADIVTKIQSQIQRQGGSFNGNEASGSFSVKVLGSAIAGAYTIAGSQMDVVINDKPFFVGCGQIESFLQSQLGG